MPGKKKSKPNKQKGEGEGGSLAGDSFFVDDSDQEAVESEREQSDAETADEKRLRLAKNYLAKLEMDKETLSEDEEEGDVIEHRLQKDVQKERGKLIENVAAKLQGKAWDTSNVKIYRGHRFSPTCLTVTPDDTTAFTGSKDCSIIRWDVETGNKRFVSIGARGREKAVPGHNNQVLGLAVSSDGNLLASGGRDRLVKLWDLRSNSLVHTFMGHRDAVTCLSFQRASHTLYSGGLDRLVKIWDTDSKALVDTLYGHQAPIHSIDSLLKERCLTGGADQTMRLWKIPEDSQLLFPATSLGILDAVSMFNDDVFLAGGEGGLALWTTTKKKPVTVLEGCHGGNSVSAVKALPFSNMACSGSSDGFVRLWELKGGGKNAGALGLTPLGAIPVTGCVNGLHISRDGRLALAAVGQDHKFGRWTVNKAARNGLQVISLQSTKAGEQDGREENMAESEDEQPATSRSTTEVGRAAQAQQRNNSKADEEEDDEGDEGDDDEGVTAALENRLVSTLNSPKPTRTPEQGKLKTPPSSPLQAPRKSARLSTPKLKSQTLSSSEPTELVLDALQPQDTGTRKLVPTTNTENGDLLEVPESSQKRKASGKSGKASAKSADAEVESVIAEQPPSSEAKTQTKRTRGKAIQPSQQPVEHEPSTPARTLRARKPPGAEDGEPKAPPTKKRTPRTRSERNKATAAS